MWEQLPAVLVDITLWMVVPVWEPPLLSGAWPNPVRELIWEYMHHPSVGCACVTQ